MVVEEVNEIGGRVTKSLWGPLAIINQSLGRSRQAQGKANHTTALWSGQPPSAGENHGIPAWSQPVHTEQGTKTFLSSMTL